MFAKRTLFLALLLLVTISYGQNSPKEIASINSRIDSLCRVTGTAIQEMNYESSLKNLESARQLSQSVNNKNRMKLSRLPIIPTFSSGNFKKTKPINSEQNHPKR